MSEAYRDGNFVTTLLGTSSSDGVTPINVYVDPVTHRLLVDIDGGSGTVTSVSFTGGIISVATATTTPAFTVAGTSGGIPYFSSASTWATSAALAANAIVIGGGAGAAPATTTTGTGVLTALGINVGSTGAFVTFNGALGTPSSGTVTNLTGTASININGTVGATTPAAGTFTTGTINTSLTMADAANIVLSGGTANGVLYLNGSKVATSGSALTFDGTNLAVGTTTYSTIGGSLATLSLGGTNATVSGGIAYQVNGTVKAYQYVENNVLNHQAQSGVSQAFLVNGSEQMRLTSTGLGLGNTSPSYTLDVTGTGRFTNNIVLSGGTANGVLYLNGSKVATSGSALTFDGTNLKLGTTSSTNKLLIDTAVSNAGSIQLPRGAFIGFSNAADNANSEYIYANGGNLELGINGSTQLDLNSSGLEVKQSQLIGYSSYAGIGTNGLAVAGNVGIGTSSPSTKLTVRGVTFTDNGVTGGASGLVYALSASNGSNFGQIGNTGTRWSLGYGPSLTALGTEVLTWNSSDNVGIGTSSPSYKLDVSGTGHFTKTVSFDEFDNGNSSTADTIDWTQGNKQKSTLTGNCTYTFTAPGSPTSLVFKLVQDATGSRTVTWPAAVHWSGGTAPTLTTTANKVDIITFYYDGTTYFGNSTLNFTA